MSTENTINIKTLSELACVSCIKLRECIEKCALGKEVTLSKIRLAEFQELLTSVSKKECKSRRMFGSEIKHTRSLVPFENHNGQK